MPWKTKNGQHIPQSRRIWRDLTTPTNDNQNIYSDSKSDEFTESIKLDFQKRIDEVDRADAILKSSVSTLVAMEPSIALTITTIKFTENFYQIISKIEKEYASTNNLPNAILNVVEIEIREKILPYIKNGLNKEIAEIIAERIWDEFKNENPLLKRDSSLESTIKQSMVTIINYSLDRLV